MADLFADIPHEGQLPGELHLDDSRAPQVRGRARPFAPGEFVRNPDGGWSNEINVTVTDPALNDGRPTNIPSLWLIDGKPVRVSEDQAAQLAAESGLSWPSFDSPDQAKLAAAARERAWQNVRPEQAGQVPPLWTRPAEAPQGGPSFRGFGGR